MAAYILGVFPVCLVTASLLLHAGFALAGTLPDASAVPVAPLWLAGGVAVRLFA